MTPLQQLTDKIYTKLPELKQLGVGCEFIHNNEKWRVISCFNEFNQTKRERYIAETVDYNESIGYAMKNFVKGSFYEKNITIIGKPPTLVDVLKWIETLKTRNNICVEHRAFSLYDDNKFYHWNDSIYLRDQDEALINFLNNLDNEK